MNLKQEARKTGSVLISGALILRRSQLIFAAVAEDTGGEFFIPSCTTPALVVIRRGNTRHTRMSLLGDSTGPG